jgi:hypothetical protein
MLSGTNVSTLYVLSLSLLSLAISTVVSCSQNKNAQAIAGLYAVPVAVTWVRMSFSLASACQTQCGVYIWCTGDWSVPSSLNCSCFSGYNSITNDGKNCSGIRMFTGYQLFSNRLTVFGPLLNCCIATTATTVTATTTMFTATITKVTATTTTSNSTSTDASESLQSSTSVNVVTVASSVGGTVVVLLLVLGLVVHIRHRRKLRVGNEANDAELSNVTTKTSAEVNLTVGDGAFIMLLFLLHEV